MNRRTWIGAVAASTVVPPRFAGAQSIHRVYRVGVLTPEAQALPVTDSPAAWIREPLRDLGYVEGRNLSIDQPYAGGDLDRLPALARELVQAKVDVIVAVAPAAMRAAQAATTTVPIVFLGNLDPVAAGFVTNLARPGGNITGILIAPDGSLAGKRLELLRAAVPRATRIALLAPGTEAFRPQEQETREAAASLGIELVVVEVRGGDYAAAFATLAAERPGALLVGSSVPFFRDRKEIIELATRHRLPAMYEWREQVVEGGLMTYSTSLAGRYRRLASYVDRILRGANPGDLPIERPTEFRLVINMKAARSIGLAIPQSLLLRADDVFE